VRTLVVAENMPWPSTGGGLIRLAQIIESIASVSELDLFIFDDPDHQGTVPPGLPVRRWTGTRHPKVSTPLRWRARFLLLGSNPIELAMVAADRGPGRALATWSDSSYDVVWFSTAAAFAWVGEPNLGPTIVDLVDLEDVKTRLRSRLILADRAGRGLASLRATAAAWQAEVNSRHWHRFHEDVARSVHTVVLSSESDARLSGLANVAVVPNTYPRPERPVGQPSRIGEPVILFQGSLGYPPNIDGAEWLCGSVAPLVRRSVPTATVRLVGRASTPVEQLDDRPAVTVVGGVPLMEEELTRATVAVVPVRFGSGTRVKILESFAHRVPVVSTTIGAEGLDVQDDVHLLIANDEESFAAAVTRLLGDAALRLRMADAAERLYLERYEGRMVDLPVHRLLEQAAASNTRR
jgi:glycosyltransferase involved in cell wall biosynthesis